MPYTKLQNGYSKNINIPYSLNDPYNPYSYTQTFSIFQNINEVYQTKDPSQSKDHNSQNNTK